MSNTLLNRSWGPLVEPAWLRCEIEKGLRAVWGPHKLRSCLDERFCQLWPPLMLNSCGLLHCTGFSSSILVLQWIKNCRWYLFPVLSSIQQNGDLWTSFISSLSQRMLTLTMNVFNALFLIEVSELIASLYLISVTFRREDTSSI